MQNRSVGGHKPADSVRAIAELPRPLAFVLSGGAASGATQVGMLKALRDADIRPDLIVGTSVGAINGAVIATNPQRGADHLEQVWREMDRTKLLGGGGLRGLSKLVRTRRHLYQADALRSIVRHNLFVKTFADLSIRFVAVATRVHDGMPVALEHGNLEPALVASAAIPGIFPRVNVANDWYLDGGVSANVPIRQAFDLGARSILVLNAAPPEGDALLPANIAETMQHVAHVLMRHQSSGVVRASEQDRVVELPRTSPQTLGAFDFTRTRELIERGYAATAAAITGKTARQSRCEPLLVPAAFDDGVLQSEQRPD